MKPIQTTVTEVNNMPGEEVEFTISAADAGLIMSSLAKLYSNRTKATIREYSTNARDSHIEAGCPDVPIEVTLPNVLHPFFTVKDQGVGMSATELKTTYTQFGRSTKRESDDYNGLLGYGSKAALAYTNSFTITAVKDGMQAIGVVTRKDNGTMVLKEILHVPTTAHNGVTIEVPVHNIDEFNRTAKEFYRFWPSGTVSINGVLNVNELDDLLDTDLYLNKDGTNECWIVMGNVAYPVNRPESLFPTAKAFQPFVAYVPNGSVEFTPAREALDYTDFTRAAVQGIVDKYLANVKANAEAEMAKAPTKWEALRASRKWYTILGTKFKYKGMDVPNKIDFLTPAGRPQMAWQTNRHWQPVFRVVEIELDCDILVVTSATATVGTYQRERLKRWWRLTNRMAPKYVYFTSETTWSNEWVDPNAIVDWETVKAQTPPEARAATSGTRVKGSWDLLTTTGDWNYAQQITNQKFWVEHWYAKNLTPGKWSDVCGMFGLTEDIIIVPANREAKFKRENPTVLNIRQHLETQVDLDGPAMYNREQKTYFNLEYYFKETLKHWDHKLVKDPELKNLIKIAQRKDIVKPSAYEINLKKANALRLNFKRFDADYEEANKMRERYPLANLNSRRPPTKHELFYVNAAYAARKDGKLD